jgi:NADH dehydrogenase [ubiquinone] 1 alpha subcomplex assembly factor 1
VLFDFTSSASSVNDWQEVSDTEREVGMSKGALIEQRTQQFQRAIFFSLLNPQPNGAGFAGVVYRKKTFDLSASSGLKLAVRAQGENFIYKVILRHHHEELSTLPSYEIFFEVSDKPVCLLPALLFLAAKKYHDATVLSVHGFQAV